MSLALLLERTLLEVVDLFEHLRDPVPRAEGVRGRPPRLRRARRSGRSVTSTCSSPPRSSTRPSTGLSSRGAPPAIPQPHSRLRSPLRQGNELLRRPTTRRSTCTARSCWARTASASTSTSCGPRRRRSCSRPSTIACARGPSTGSLDRVLHHWVLGNTPPRLVPLRDVARAADAQATSTSTRSAGWPGDVAGRSRRGSSPCGPRGTPSRSPTATALSFWAYRYEPEPWEERGALSVLPASGCGLRGRRVRSPRSAGPSPRHLQQAGLSARALTFPKRDTSRAVTRASPERWRRGLRDLGR